MSVIKNEETVKYSIRQAKRHLSCVHTSMYWVINSCYDTHILSRHFLCSRLSCDLGHYINPTGPALCPFLVAVIVAEHRPWCLAAPAETESTYWAFPMMMRAALLGPVSRQWIRAPELLPPPSLFPSPRPPEPPSPSPSPSSSFKLPQVMIWPVN